MLMHLTADLLDLMATEKGDVGGLLASDDNGGGGSCCNCSSSLCCCAHICW
jgi:hypothetical protein